MNIVVCYKIVPDEEGIAIKADRSVDVSGAQWSLGEYDLEALEAAVQLRDSVGGKVTVLTVGGDEVLNSKLKKSILSRGADDQIVVCSEAFANLDAYCTAEVLARALGSTEYDLVLCGEGSSDMYSQQVGMILGQMLGLPVFNAVSSIAPAENGLLIGRSLDDCEELIEITLPAVLSAAAGIATPRIPSMKDRVKDDALLEKRLKSVGKVALGAKIKIVAPDGSECPVGRQGEIYAQGLGQMMCYYNAPDKTASVFSDGWYHTGDVGYLDEDNYLYLVGRMSDMIISGGENVYPKSVEECILALDGVENVAVVGLKDDHLGEAVTAVIVKAPGAELDKATVRNWCKGKIAGFMKPRKVFFVNELPVNSTGKIDKRKLTEMFN